MVDDALELVPGDMVKSALSVRVSLGLVLSVKVDRRVTPMNWLVTVLWDSRIVTVSRWSLRKDLHAQTW